MLTLKDNQSKCEHKPPKFIHLSLGHNLIGRSYQADVKLFKYPWLSRKHLSITKVDDSHYLEVLGRSSVFVNRRSVTFSSLSEGDQIIIGGAGKNYPVASHFPECPGPYLEYTYSYTVHTTGKENCYKDPAISAEEVICLEESRDGRMIQEKYHLQDFENTQDSFEIERQLLAASPSLQPNMPPKTARGKKAKREAKKCPVQPLAELDSEDAVTSRAVVTPSKRVKKRAVKKSATVSRPQDVDADSRDEAWQQYDRVLDIANRTLDLLDEREKEEAVAGTSASGAGPSTSSSAAAPLTESNRPSATVSSTRPKRLHKLLKYTFSDEDFSDGVTPKKQKVSHNEDKDLELPDLDAPNAVSDLLAIEPWRKKKGSKKKAAGPTVRGVATEGAGQKRKKKGSCKVCVKRDEGQQAVLDCWFRRLVQKTVTSDSFVTLVSGSSDSIEYQFQDLSVFKWRYLTDCPSSDMNSIGYLREDPVELKIDVSKLRDHLLLGLLSDIDRNKVYRLVSKQMNKFSMDDYNKARTAPMDCVTRQSPDVRLQLKQYQLNTIGWMRRLEDRVDRGFTATKLIKWHKLDLDLEFDVVNKRVFEPPCPISKETMVTVKSRGGILADQMGLGKTITVLGLILENKCMRPKIPSPKDFNHQESFYLPTGATLVVAPSHLTSQWKEEVETHTNGLTVIVITTKVQYEKVAYVDILEADVVVVSVQFLLTNKVFTSLATGVDGETGFMQFMRKTGRNPLLVKGPNLMHFRWWRLIADEAHEIMTYDMKGGKQTRVQTTKQWSQGLQKLKLIKSRFRWYVTGTPFPQGRQSLKAALKFLEVSVDDESLQYPDGSVRVDCENPGDEVNLYPLHSVIYNHLYVRNTKTSIGLDYNVPEYIEELILLTMGEIERGIYDRSVTDLEQRQVCCHLQIVDRIRLVAGVQQKSQDEVRVALVNQARKDIEQTTRDIEFTKNHIKEDRLAIDREVNPQVRKMLERRLKDREKTIKSNEESLVKHHSALSYFESIVPRINHSADEPCVICLETISRLTVTPCAHMYCYKCIVQCLRTNGQCPTCRKTVRENQLIEVKDAQARVELEKCAELKALTEVHGTKMAYLIFYLRNLFQAEQDSRVIIFSQWDSLLQKIGVTLDENAINNVFVKGNVHMRNKAIKSFRKQEKTRVIMLSLQNAASGTNLVEATHVVLIDPVAGSAEEAIAIESQAIGRAHRMGQEKQISVVRMIMKDTIEHELYKRNSDDGNIQQVEFNFEKKGAFGGPQIVKCKRKVPEPEPEILQQALRRQEEESRLMQQQQSRGRRNMMDSRALQWVLRSYPEVEEEMDMEEEWSFDEEDEDDYPRNNCTVS